MTRDGKRAYVGLGRANHVAVISVPDRKVTGYTLVGKRAWNVVLTRDEKTLYVCNGLSDDLSVVDTATLKVEPVGAGRARSLHGDRRRLRQDDDLPKPRIACWPDRRPRLRRPRLPRRQAAADRLPGARGRRALRRAPRGGAVPGAALGAALRRRPRRDRGVRVRRERGGRQVRAPPGRGGRRGRAATAPSRSCPARG